MHWNSTVGKYRGDMLQRCHHFSIIDWNAAEKWLFNQKCTLYLCFRFQLDRYRTMEYPFCCYWQLLYECVLLTFGFSNMADTDFVDSFTTCIHSAIQLFSSTSVIVWSNENVSKSIRVVFVDVKRKWSVFSSKFHLFLNMDNSWYTFCSCMKC